MNKTFLRPRGGRLCRGLLSLLVLAVIATACGSGQQETPEVEVELEDGASGGDNPDTDSETGTDTDTDGETGTDSGTDTDTGSGTDTEAEADVEAIDLTGKALVSTEAACAAHLGQYTSMVTDRQTGIEYQGLLSITADGDTCTLSSNQIPNHDMGIDADFANEAGEVDAVFTIPANPTAGAQPTALGFTTHAVMLNGVIWEAFPAACFGEGPDPLGREAIGCGGNLLDHPWRYNVGSDLNPLQLDAYHAHAQPSGLYHYHSTPEALYESPCSGVSESPVVGFARDGFPIYGPCFTDPDGTVRVATSSYQLQSGVRQDVDGYVTPTAVGNVLSDEYNGQFIGDFQYVEGAGDLDQCNGMEVDGQYGYYLTADYPYVLGCFVGTPSTSFGQ